MRHQSPKTISIIIPVLNEGQGLNVLLDHLKKIEGEGRLQEIILVDGGSQDHTVHIGRSRGITVLRSEMGRAKQMNAGAQMAVGDILYFLHADTFPPKGFLSAIGKAAKNGKEAGCFRMRFDTDNVFLRLFGWCTRINHLLCRGGDQSLFVTKTLFDKTGGFNENFVIYEDIEFIGRLYKRTNFNILTDQVTTSARRYREKGILRLQFHFGMIHLNYFLGAGPYRLYGYYKRNIGQARRYSSKSDNTPSDIHLARACRLSESKIRR